jgi:hypothetical protein
LKEAMIDYAVEQALTQGQGFSSTVSSYKMGDRTISFRENSAIQDKVLSVVKKYRSGF